ncbi:MAG: uroporphyrinogen-III C-methyltransferase [Alkalinema sp. RU_4_3]|nr:uroporphyrinogen-III C-methyltransferase [Alkalinema sp. RU_4_3]
MTQDSKGKVYLVGSGCGTLGQLTLQAHQLLSTAEVVVYDALVDGELLAIAPPSAKCFDVGKRGGQPSLKQPEIDALLVEQAQTGAQVVRLKCGDPVYFGRTTSEIQALRAAGCDYQVVPGVSSALAAPLFAGIPLTDLVLSRAFAVVSGHAPDELDWEALVAIDTLVILMGGRSLFDILRQLERHGKRMATPIAIIRMAGRPEQQVWTGTIETIWDQVQQESLSPCVIVMGEVVGLRAFCAQSA